MKTAITQLFGIKHPIMLAGMNWITEPKLVSAVSNAGGLGLLAIAHLTPEEARKQIRAIRQLTDKPFGINQTLHVPLSKENIKVALEEQVPVINYSLGKPWFINDVHKYGGKVIGTVAVVKHAVRAEQLGCDALSVTGYEAAAHGGDAASLVLIPLVASAVKIPFWAAGGFFDGRGLAAALLLGAGGVSLGTRLVVTQESNVHAAYKQKIMEASEQDTLYSDRFDGMPGRVLRTPGAESMMRSKGVPLFGGLAAAMHVKRMLGLSWGQVISAAFSGSKSEFGSEGQYGIFQKLRFAGGAIGQEKAIYDGDMSLGFMFAGQNVGGIRDIPSVNEVISRIVAEAEGLLKNAGSKFLE